MLLPSFREYFGKASRFRGFMNLRVPSILNFCDLGTVKDIGYSVKSKIMKIVTLQFCATHKFIKFVNFSEMTLKI